MAKSEVIALVAESRMLRGVRYSARGREGWTRTGGGAWPIESPEETAPAAEGGVAQQAAVIESDKPLARALRAARSALGARQVVVGLPLSRLLVRVLKLPVEVKEELLDAVSLQMDKLSPFPGEELSVGCEVLSEGDEHVWVLAAAMPSAVSDELGSALHEARLQVSRTDVSALGWFRALCGPLQLARPGRRVLLMDPDAGWDLWVVDHGIPVLVRGLGDVDDPGVLARDVMLSLFNAELEAGHAAVSEVLVISADARAAGWTAPLSEQLGVPVRLHTLEDLDAGVEGVAMRSGEGVSMDLTPQAWREVARESLVRKRVVTFVAIAAAVWAVFMGVLFSGPFVYKQMTDRVRAASRAHAKAYKQVSDMRARVNLILSYMDRTYSPLEMLRMASGYLPQGITLTGFNYRRDDGVKITGEADLPTLVYEFKNAVTEDPLFESVSLTGPSASKGKNKFDVDAKFKGTAHK